MSEVIGLFPTPVMRVPRVLDTNLLAGLVGHFVAMAQQENNSSANLSHTTMLKPSDSPLLIEAAALIDSAQAQYQAMAEQLAQRAETAKVPFHFEAKTGHPAERIVACAQAHNADLIVMGHRGKSLVERWLTGSTTKQVMGYAHCPVLIVR